MNNYIPKTHQKYYAKTNKYDDLIVLIKLVLMALLSILLITFSINLLDGNSINLNAQTQLQQKADTKKELKTIDDYNKLKNEILNINITK